MTVVMSVSFAALIFVDPISSFASEGASVMLMTAVIMGIFMAIFSSYAGTIAIPQDRVAPIVALMATMIVHDMHGAAPETVGLTVLAAIAISTILVGLVLFFLGAYKLGNIVRYTPYPVIGGFLAGSGWLLVMGSLRVVSGKAFSFSEVNNMIASGTMTAWIPCALFGPSPISPSAIRELSDAAHARLLRRTDFLRVDWIQPQHPEFGAAAWLDPGRARSCGNDAYPDLSLLAAGGLARDPESMRQPGRAAFDQHHLHFAQHLGA